MTVRLATLAEPSHQGTGAHVADLSEFVYQPLAFGFELLECRHGVLSSFETDSLYSCQIPCLFHSRFYILTLMTCAQTHAPD